MITAEQKVPLHPSRHFRTLSFLANILIGTVTLVSGKPFVPLGTITNLLSVYAEAAKAGSHTRYDRNAFFLFRVNKLFTVIRVRVLTTTRYARVLSRTGILRTYHTISFSFHFFTVRSNLPITA